MRWIWGFVIMNIGLIFRTPGRVRELLFPKKLGQLPSQSNSRSTITPTSLANGAMDEEVKRAAYQLHLTVSVRLEDLSIIWHDIDKKTYHTTDAIM